MNKTAHISVLFTALLLVLTVSGLRADQTKWLAIGSLHSWYSSVGCEIELGRTGVFDEQQDGLRWPALYRWQDSQAAKALWIGTRDYQDPTIDKFYNYKVVHIGPRLVDEVNAFMPVEFTLYGKFDHPTVVVDGALASHTTYMDKVDAVDANLPCDRLLVNRVNTSIGVSMQRKIHAFSQQYHDNYFIHDYVFKNTGIYDLDASVDTKTLNGVYFLFQYRIAVCREVGDHGLNYMPQAVDWGHNTLHHVLRGDPYRCFYAWHGLYSKVSYDNIGAPYIPGDGHLGATQFPGVVTIHADVSAGNKSDDPEQPAMTQHIGSDIDITHSQDQYNPAMMTMEYELMSSGHPEQTHAEATGDEFADIGTPGGYSQCFAYGPYDLAPGDSIHIVFAEGVNGLSRAMCYEIGAQWLDAYHNPGVSFDFPMPDGTTASGSYGDGTADQFKNAWTMTGVDSILNTFGRARQHWQNDMIHDPAPPPPDLFNVTSCGDQIALDWSESAESYAHFGGYHIYRAIHTPDTTFDRIYSCGQGTGNPLIISTMTRLPSAVSIIIIISQPSMTARSTPSSPASRSRAACSGPARSSRPICAGRRRRIWPISRSCPTRTTSRPAPISSAKARPTGSCSSTCRRSAPSGSSANGAI